MKSVKPSFNLAIVINDSKLTADIKVKIKTTGVPRFLSHELYLIRNLAYKEAEKMVRNSSLAEVATARRIYHDTRGLVDTHAVKSVDLTIGDMNICVYFCGQPSSIPLNAKGMFDKKSISSLDKLTQQELTLHANSFTQKLQDTLGIY